jgi:hypothetical protein
MFDTPDPLSVLAAKAERRRVRAAMGYPPETEELPTRFESLTEDQIALLDATEVIERLAERLGSYRRVLSVLRTVALIHGEEV